MTKFFTLLAATAMIASAPALASEKDHHDAERIEHYEGAELKSAEEATTLLDEKMAEISTMLEAETLEDATLESIHEMSYALEDAVDVLRKDVEGENAALDQLDEAVQALHYASEEHEAEKTREWFAKIQGAAGELNNAKTENVSEAPVKKDVYEIVIKDHKFTPETLTVPAGEKIKLLVDNQDATPEEFESHDMNREKIIGGNTKATIFVGPLEPGKYHYFGEFNMDSANGYIVAEAAE